MKLAGLPPSRELTLGRREETCALSANPVVLPRTFKSTLQVGKTFSVVLQVNVTSSFSGTTYTPGISIGTASPDTSRVTEN